MPELPASDHKGASSVYLPRLDPTPATVLDFLTLRFSHIPRETWRLRMAEGKVIALDGTPIPETSPYLEGETIRYFREVVDETMIPFTEEIILQTPHFIIADKPHFLPVVPTGPFVDECLLHRLRRRTGIPSLTPVHRLDRETAGLVLLAADPETRPLYHRLFADRAIVKEYHAVVETPAPIEWSRLTIEKRMEPGEPWFLMKIAPGEANSRTEVSLLNERGNEALLRLLPESGRKHQLRLHLASIGMPIVNDQLYPVVWPHAPYDYEHPLQLLASRLSFRDPVSGEVIEARSERHLRWSDGEATW